MWHIVGDIKIKQRVERITRLRGLVHSVVAVVGRVPTRLSHKLRGTKDLEQLAVLRAILKVRLRSVS